MYVYVEKHCFVNFTRVLWHIWSPGKTSGGKIFELFLHP